LFRCIVVVSKQSILRDHEGLHDHEGSNWGDRLLVILVAVDHGLVGLDHLQAAGLRRRLVVHERSAAYPRVVHLPAVDRRVPHLLEPYPHLVHRPAVYRRVVHRRDVVRRDVADRPATARLHVIAASA
jgi:hypothetical protein